jgi:hypothetical protein
VAPFGCWSGVPSSFGSVVSSLLFAVVGASSRLAVPVSPLIVQEIEVACYVGSFVDGKGLSEVVVICYIVGYIGGMVFCCLCSSWLLNTD